MQCVGCEGGKRATLLVAHQQGPELPFCSYVCSKAFCNLLLIGPKRKAEEEKKNPVKKAPEDEEKNKVPRLLVTTSTRASTVPTPRPPGPWESLPLDIRLMILGAELGRVSLFQVWSTWKRVDPRAVTLMENNIRMQNQFYSAYYEKIAVPILGAPSGRLILPSWRQQLQAYMNTSDIAVLKPGELTLQQYVPLRSAHLPAIILEVGPTPEQDQLIFYRLDMLWGIMDRMRPRPVEFHLVRENGESSDWDAIRSTWRIPTPNRILARSDGPVRTVQPTALFPLAEMMRVAGDPMIQLGVRAERLAKPSHLWVRTLPDGHFYIRHSSIPLYAHLGDQPLPPVMLQTGIKNEKLIFNFSFWTLQSDEVEENSRCRSLLQGLLCTRRHPHALIHFATPQLREIRLYDVLFGRRRYQEVFMTVAENGRPEIHDNYWHDEATRPITHLTLGSVQVRFCCLQMLQLPADVSFHNMAPLDEHVRDQIRTLISDSSSKERPLPLEYCNVEWIYNTAGDHRPGPDARTLLLDVMINPVVLGIQAGVIRVMAHLTTRPHHQPQLMRTVSGQPEPAPVGDYVQPAIDFYCMFDAGDFGGLTEHMQLELQRAMERHYRTYVLEELSQHVLRRPLTPEEEAMPLQLERILTDPTRDLVQFTCHYFPQSRSYVLLPRSSTLRADEVTETVLGSADLIASKVKN